MKSKITCITTALLILLLTISCSTPVDEIFYLEPSNDEALAAESNETEGSATAEETIITASEVAPAPLADLSYNEVIPEPLPVAEPIEPKSTEAPPAPKNPAPEKTSTPAPEKTSTPAPEKTSTPAPEKTSTPAPEITSTPAPAAPTVTTETTTQTDAATPKTSTAEPEAEEQASVESVKTVTAEPPPADEQIMSSDSKEETVRSTSADIPDNDEHEEESLSLSTAEPDSEETTNNEAAMLPEEEPSEPEAAALDEFPIDPIERYGIEEKQYLFSNLNETHLFIITGGSFVLLGIVLIIIFRKRGQHQYADENDE